MSSFSTIFNGFALMLLLSSAFNHVHSQEAVITIDGNPEIEGNSSGPESVIAGETFYIAITAQNVQSLHSYSFKCQFDTQVVQFKGAVAKLSPMAPAFLESQNGSIAAFLAIPDKNCVEIAATQSGNEKKKCVSGDGVLGYLSFISKRNGDPDIVLIEARLVSPDGLLIKSKINQ